MQSVEILVDDIIDIVDTVKYQHGKDNKTINKKIESDIEILISKMHQQFQGKSLEITTESSKKSKKAEIITDTYFTILKKQQQQTLGFKSQSAAEKYFIWINILEIMNILNKQVQNEINLKVKSLIKNVYSFIDYSKEEEKNLFLDS